MLSRNKAKSSKDVIKEEVVAHIANKNDFWLRTTCGLEWNFVLSDPDPRKNHSVSLDGDIINVVGYSEMQEQSDGSIAPAGGKGRFRIIFDVNHIEVISYYFD